jgi:hypothetical protein
MSRIRQPKLQPDPRQPTFLQNDHVSKKLDIDTALFNLDQTSQDLSHGFGPRLDVHCTDSKHNRLDIRLFLGRLFL